MVVAQGVAEEALEGCAVAAGWVEGTKAKVRAVVMAARAVGWMVGSQAAVLEVVVAWEEEGLVVAQTVALGTAVVHFEAILEAVGKVGAEKEAMAA